MTDTTPIGLEAWLDRLRTHLPANVVATVGADERGVLLDLARVAAHRGERTAAPITTYLAGVALADLAPGDRLSGLRALLAALDA